MQSFRTGLAVVALTALALPAPLRAAPPAVAAPVQKSEAALVLLEVRLGSEQLSDAVSAYELGRDIYLPLGEMARLLTLAIRVAPEAGRASGYILAEERHFSLDLPARVADLAGRREALDPAQFLVQDEDIYVASRLLARWLPVDLDLDMSGLVLKVRPREQLPLQARLARRRHGSLPGMPGGYVDPGYPRLDTPYRLADVPFVDQTLGFTLDRRGPQHSTDARSTDVSTTTYLTADLLGMEAALYLNRNRRAPSTGLRLTLGRKDPDAGLLGPLGARSVLVGSVPVPGVANVSLTSAAGDGIALGNRPLDQPASYDRHTLQGGLPPGWDVELYYNDALVGLQQSGPSGMYSFADQPLAYGPNEFRLVFHGPLGQTRVERRSFLLEQTALPRGALFYDLAAHRDADGQVRALARVEWGAGAHLNLVAGWQRLPLFDAMRSYTSLGLRSYWSRLIVTADAVRADDGGRLVQLGLKTRIGPIALTASRARLDDFNSEVFRPASDPVRIRDEVHAEGVLALGAANVFPLSLQLRRDLLASGAEQRDVQARLSAYRDGTALSNTLRWQSLASGAPNGKTFIGTRRADGQFQLSRRVAGVGVAGQLHYTLAPEKQLASAAVSTDWRLGQSYLLNLGATRLFRERELQWTAALNKSLGSFGLGVNAFYVNRGAYGLGVQLFMAMGLEPRTARLLREAQPMAGMGAASLRVFVDANQNGVMDEDEEAIKGAGFIVNGACYGARTDAAGLAWLARLPANRHTDIGLDPDTLEDPQWQPQRRGVRIVPRPGKVSQVDFAVSLTGEVDGTTYLAAGGTRRPIGDLRLQLVDAGGKVAATIGSGADGYYVLTGVFPGAYRLRVDPEQLARLGLVEGAGQAVTIGPEGTILNGRDLEVRRAGEG
ncbi:carboxypeptidase-like regulatory domain-containing protein [Massilia sp.]|uniref:carboxypeptidase-like regulatory domain-containing protein n=1 Tax=Massilia sp. TaxID=1882437 RepID=UPI002899C942|nr:carboxypeptidase-like regulatory domain-containing protein [Massilia sp.]